MAVYTYRATDSAANIHTGRAQARDEDDLETRLSLQGLTLIESTRSSLFDRPAGGIRFSNQDLADFSYFLHMIITSGLPVMNSLADLARNHDNARLSFAADVLYGKLEAGMSLSEAMQEHPAIFPNFYVQMVMAGEASGRLEAMLIDVMRYLEWQIEFRKTVRSATIYPMMVLGAVLLLVIALFTFVFPRLIGILTGLRVDLPLSTKVLLAVSGFIGNYFILIVLGAIAAIALMRLWLRTDAGRRRFDGFLLSIPIVGRLIRQIDLSRYCKTLATLHAAGLNVERTFTISADVVRNRVLSEGLAAVTQSVINGQGIASSMQQSGIFPPLVIEMVAVGEKAGNLDGAVKRVSDMFDKQVPETLKKVFSFLEPVIIVLLGALVLTVLLSVFLPIYKIVGGIRAR